MFVTFSHFILVYWRLGWGLPEWIILGDSTLTATNHSSLLRHSIYYCSKKVNSVCPGYVYYLSINSFIDKVSTRETYTIFFICPCFIIATTSLSNSHYSHILSYLWEIFTIVRKVDRSLKYVYWIVTSISNSDYSPNILRYPWKYSQCKNDTKNFERHFVNSHYCNCM